MRLKGGDPFVFGRGGEEAEACIAAGVDFEVVPGITSAIAAAAYAGIPVTHRGVSTSVTIVTGHEDPAKGTTDTDWDALARGGRHARDPHGRGPRRRDREGADRGRARPTHAGRRGALGHAAVAAHDARDARRDRRRARRVEAPSAIVVGDVAALDFAWFERRPLFGRTIVVTRAREQASELRARLEALGAEVIELPAIAIEPIDVRRCPTSAAYAWLVFTSANGVDAFFDRGLDAAGLDARALAPVRVAAIGPGTADALAARGMRADLVPERFVAGVAARRVPRGRRAGCCSPGAEVARDVLPDGLAAKGYEVDVLAVYRTVAGRARSRGARAACVPGEVDAITFTSSSTVHNFCDAVGALPDPQPLVVSIGPVTSETARARGLRVDAEADPHTIDGLDRGASSRPALRR